VNATAESDERARQLSGMGFKPLDALHLSFAEKAAARWFVTTDDQLMRRARERQHEMQVEVVAPDQLIMDEEQAE
jgi:predicted nucleic acid-binding protein